MNPQHVQTAFFSNGKDLHVARNQPRTPSVIAVMNVSTAEMPTGKRRSEWKSVSEFGVMFLDSSGPA